MLWASAAMAIKGGLGMGELQGHPCRPTLQAVPSLTCAPSYAVLPVSPPLGSPDLPTLHTVPKCIPT